MIRCGGRAWPAGLGALRARVTRGPPAPPGPLWLGEPRRHDTPATRGEAILGACSRVLALGPGARCQAPGQASVRHPAGDPGGGVEVPIMRVMLASLGLLAHAHARMRADGAGEAITAAAPCHDPPPIARSRRRSRWRVTPTAPYPLARARACAHFGVCHVQATPFLPLCLYPVGCCPADRSQPLADRLSAARPQSVCSCPHSLPAGCATCLRRPGGRAPSPWTPYPICILLAGRPRAISGAGPRRYLVRIACLGDAAAVRAVTGASR